MTTADKADALTLDELTPAGDSSASSADSPGQQLRRAREARGLDISQLATSLRIAPQVVEALEQDDYARLPSAVFVSGYIRSYARLVGLDPEPLNQRFRRRHPDAEPPPRHVARTEAADSDHEAGGLAVYLIAVLVVLALVAGGYGWWVSRPGQSAAEQAGAPPDADQNRTAGSPAPSSAFDARAPERPAQASSAETEAATALETEIDAPSMEASDLRTASPPPTESSADVVIAERGDQGPASRSIRATDAPTDATVDADDDILTDRSAGSAARGPTQAPAVAALPTPASPDDERPALTTTATPSADNAAEDAGTTETPTILELAADTTADNGTETGTESSESSSKPVELSFTGTCWVDIRDSTGEVLLFGEMSRGDREILGGEPPYSLVIGNAAAAELTVAGQAYDLDAVARGNVARFQLDPAEFDAESANPSPDTAVEAND
ncbi:RodZ domain-containing protein [Halochromatium sp.]